MTNFIVTVDLDWACEAAIEETLDFLKASNIPITIFATHRSPKIEAELNHLDVGLHPYFASDSSHGTTVAEVVTNILKIPHNLPAFRCHRFAICNTSKKAMIEAGMVLSSNVCTDLEVVSPFRDRFGILEVPIFLEDGGYLWNNHPLELTPKLKQMISCSTPKVIIIHPMHFAINSPNFNYMYNIKQQLTREEWNNMSKSSLEALRWKGRGIRDLIIDILDTKTKISTLRSLIYPS